jgi:hypothetical protein
VSAEQLITITRELVAPMASSLPPVAPLSSINSQHGYIPLIALNDNNNNNNNNNNGMSSGRNGEKKSGRIQFGFAALPRLVFVPDPSPPSPLPLPPPRRRRQRKVPQPLPFGGHRAWHNTNTSTKSTKRKRQSKKHANASASLPPLSADDEGHSSFLIIASTYNIKE